MGDFFVFFVFKWVVRIEKQHRVRVLLGDIRLQVGVIEEFLDKVPHEMRD